MINTIILDIGNVMAHFGTKEYLQSCGYEEEVIRKVMSATVQSKFWREWDRSSREEAEIIELCCKQQPEVEKEIKEFFNHIRDMVQEYDYSEGFVKQLKDNCYKVYILSNYSRWNYENDKKKFRFLQHVDGGVISHEVNHVKPEAEIYQSLINKYNINPEEAVFLDDLEENLEGAKTFGIHTILFTSFDNALEELRLLQVNI